MGDYSSSTKQYLWGVGWAQHHPGEFVHKKRSSWRSVETPDLFGPVWVWDQL